MGLITCRKGIRRIRRSQLRWRWEITKLRREPIGSQTFKTSEQEDSIFDTIGKPTVPPY